MGHPDAPREAAATAREPCNAPRFTCQGSLLDSAAWAVFDWSFTAKLANGEPFTSKGRESHVYERTDRGLRITHLHYSGLPPPSLKTSGGRGLLQARHKAAYLAQHVRFV